MAEAKEAFAKMLADAQLARKGGRPKSNPGAPPTASAAAAKPKPVIVAPPAAQHSTWTRRFGDYSDAFASGWMQLRGTRRRRAVDRGFVLSDHADWPGLQRAIAATGAERVIVTHGYEAIMVRWLQEQGLQAGAFQTEYDDERALAEKPAGDVPSNE